MTLLLCNHSHWREASNQRRISHLDLDIAEGIPGLPQSRRRIGYALLKSFQYQGFSNVQTV
jgi:hypothetical protein